MRAVNLLAPNMSDFDSSSYFKKKIDSLNLPKGFAIQEAMQRKVADLQEYQVAVAAGRALTSPDRTVGDIAGDVAITAAKSAIGLPESIVGIADIPTGGRVGKFIEENTPIQFKKTKEILDSGLSDAQKEANLRVQLAEGFGGTIEAALDNPSVIATTVGESLGSMIGGAAAARKILGVGAKAVSAGAGATGPVLPGVLARKVGTDLAPVIAGAVGEGILGAGSAASQIRGETEDGLLTPKQALSAVGSGAGTAVLGFAGGKLAQKLGVPDLDTALAAGTVKSPAGFLKAVVGAGISEGVFEEMPQSAQEQVWQNYALDKPLLEGVDKASAMGLLAGVAMGSGTGVAGALAPSDAAKRKRNDRDEDPAREAVLETASKTGNVDALLNIKSKDYSPENAVLALLAHAKNPETSGEQRATNLSKAQEVMAGLERQRDAARSELELESPEGLAAKLGQVQEVIASAPEEDRALYEEMLAELQARQVEMDTNPDRTQAIKALTDQISGLDGQISKARQSVDQIAGLVSAPEQVSADMALLSQAVNTQDSDAVAAQQQAAERIINLSMASPDRVDRAQALALVKTAGNALTNQQRAYLRAFSDARVADNLAKDADVVSSDIWRGSSKGAEVKYWGIKQYRREIAAAIAAGDQAKATRLLAQMQSFNTDHSQKARLLSKVKDGQQIMRTDAGWVVNTGKRLTNAERDANGAFTKNSDEVVGKIGREASVLRAATAELAAAVTLKFPTTAGDINVPNSAQSTNPSTGQSRSTQSASGQAATSEGQSESAGAAAPVAAGNGVDSQSTGVGVSDSTPVAQKAEKTQETATEVQSTTTQDPVEVIEESNQNDTAISEAPAAPTQDQLAESVEDAPLDELSAESAEASSTETQPGTLAAVLEKGPEGATFFDKRLGDFVAQVGKSRPLVAVKDFMDEVRAGKKKITDFLPDTELSDDQKNVIRLLSGKLRQWSDPIKKNLRPRDKFQHEDPIRFLTGSGDLEQNVKTAMVAAAFTWLNDEIRRKSNTDEAINALLGRDSDHQVSLAERNLFNEGSYQSTVAEALGQRIIAALGFKAFKDAPQDILPKLKMSLGSHALALLEQQGMVESFTVPDSVIRRMRGEDLEVAEQGGKPDLDHTFYKLVQDSKEVLDITDTMAGTKGILDKLFGIESSQIRPSLAPVKGVQKTTDTGMGVPNALQKVVRQNQTKNERHLNTGPMDVLAKLDEELALAIAGVVRPDEHTHGAKRRSIEAKNDGLAREYKNFMEFVLEDLVQGEGKDKGFFYRYDVWKQQRVGIKTNVGNPQTSKIARWLTYSKAWNTEIRFDDTNLMTGFMLRVAEGLGVKTERGASELSVAKAEAALKQPEMVAGVAAIRAALDGADLSAEQQAAVVAAVKAAGEKMHSLAALVAWAQHQAAKEAGQEAFTTNLMGEVDGVANGTMLNHVLYGAGTDGLLERGGFFTLDSKFRQFNLWRGTPGNLDIYEATAKKISQYIASMSDLGQLTGAIWSVIGNPVDTEGNATKDGRTLVKSALNPLNYGSGFNSVKRNLAGEFIESIYSAFEDFSSGKRPSVTKPESLNDFVQQLNVLLAQTKNTRLLPINEPASFYLEANVLSYKQIDALESVYTGIVGQAVEDVVGVEFGGFMASTKQLIKTTQLTYDLFNAVYQAEREKLIADLGIPTRKKRDAEGVPVHDLTAEQEGELRSRLASIMPLMHTAMSQRDDNYRNGILLAKRELQRAPNNSYEVEVTFGQKIKNGQHTMTVRPQVMGQAGPGVLAVSAGTHSTDSAISHDTQDGRPILNIHDALGGGVGGLAEMTTAFNKATFENLLAYSPLRAGHNALARVVTGLAKMHSDGQLSDQALANIKKVLKSGKSLDKALQDSFEAALLADRSKLDIMSRWAVVDQYPMDNNGYQVTDADRKRVNTLAANLAPDVAPLTQAASEVLNQALGFKAEKKAPAQKPAAKQSNWGTVGTPTAAPNPLLLSLLQGKGKVSAKSVVETLQGVQWRNPGYKLLLDLVAKALPDNLTVQMVDTSTPVDQVIEMPKMPSKAWMVSGSGRNEIYFLGPEFAASAMTPETLLHELLHGALARYLVDLSSGKVKDPDAQALVAELEKLLERARKHELADKYQAALSNLDEFISWGMTNAAFQADVLTKLRVTHKSSQNKWLSGMQDFMRNLTQLMGKALGRKLNGEAVNGLGLLVANVTGLVKAAEQQKAGDPAEATLNLSMAAVDDYTTSQIFQALNEPSKPLEPAFESQLSRMLGGIVNTLHGPFGAFAAAVRGYAPASPLDAWLVAQQNGLVPFSSEVAANLPASQQELFVIEQIEATVKAALQDNAALTKVAYKELTEVFSEAQQTLKPSDFKDPAHYDFIFGVKAAGSDGKSDYLARFAALALAHQGLNKLLQVPSKKTRNISDGKTLADKVEIAFEKILGFFSRMATKTFDGQRLDSKVQTLVEQLVSIEAKQREAIKDQQARKDFLAPVEEMVKTGRDAVMSKLEAAAGSEFFRNAKSGAVRGGAALVRTVAMNRQEEFLKQFQDYRDNTLNERGGFLSSILNEVVGQKEFAEKALRVVKHFENRRKGVIDGTSKMALESFINEGKDLTEEAKAALTRVFMRTGAHTLMGRYDFTQLQSMLTDRAAILKEVAAIEAAFPAKLRRLYVGQAQALGLHKATGLVEGLVMPNAHVIARMLGTPYQQQIDADQAAAHEDGVKALITLYALLHTDKASKTEAAQVLAKELARDDGGNGVDFLLKATRQFEQDSLERLFAGNPVLMQHGYTPEIYNPHTDIKVVTAEEGQKLAAQGYTAHSKLSEDPADPDSESKQIFVRSGAALARWESGVMSLTDVGTKGTTIHNGFTNPKHPDGAQNASRQAAVTQAKMNLLRQPLGPHRDMSKTAKSGLVPVYNEQGKIVNWRYLMREQTKDVVLQRNNRFEDVLGTYAGSIFDKTGTPKNNLAAIQALKTQYDADGSVRRLKGYHLVGPDSPDAELRTIWGLLPEQAKADVKRIWGLDGMWVHTDSLDIMFGYRAASAAEFLRKDKEALNGIQAAMREWFHGMAKTMGKSDEEANNLAKKWGWQLAKGEEAWKEIVKEMKDIIVVKSGIVMLNNIRSNFTQLVLSGVPVKDMVRHHLVGMRGAMAYERDFNELQRLETLLAVDYTIEGQANIERQIAKLKDSLARNPVRELIEAGLMPTIVEDVAADDDLYSYKSVLASKVAPLTQRVPVPLRDAAKTVYMAHDTKLYGALNRVARLSDFVARYALYQHLTTRAVDQMTSEQAIQRASETFINYDIPMHRGMQYLDSMGLFMFTKYFLRVQRVLARTFKESPGRVLGMIAADYFADVGPNVLEGSAVNHFGDNPWRWGAFQFPGTLDKLATVAVPMSIIK
jgi:hypothetical protein